MPCICLKSSGGLEWLCNLSDIKKPEGESSHNQHFATPHECWICSFTTKVTISQQSKLQMPPGVSLPKCFIIILFQKNINHFSSQSLVHLSLMCLRLILNCL